jgi:hypothetical protein
MAYVVFTLILAGAVRRLRLDAYWDTILRIFDLGPLPGLVGFSVAYASGALAPNERFFTSVIVGGMAILYFAANAALELLARGGDPWSVLSLVSALAGGVAGIWLVLREFEDE